MLSMVAPLYISEISPPEIRGALLVLEEFAIVTGIVIAFWITYGTQYMDSEWSWRLPFLLQMIPGFLLGVGVLWLPFSPRWLVAKGRNAEALKSLVRIRGLPAEDKRVQAEYFDIKAEARLQQVTLRERHSSCFCEGEKKPSTTGRRLKLELLSWGDLFSKGCWKRTQAAAGMMFFQQVCIRHAIFAVTPTTKSSISND